MSNSPSKTALGIILTMVLVFFVHRSATEHEFVSWDDDINLYANPNLIAGDIRWELPWVEPYQGMWIPVTYSMWGAIAGATRTEVEFASYELAPAPFHAANLVLHVASSALVLLLLLNWLPESIRKRRTLAALIGALLFGLHPIQVEAVHWATALKDTLSAFLALASLVCVSTAPKRFTLRMPLAWLLFALALASKPAVVVVPVVWLCFAIVRDGNPTRWAWLHFGTLLGLAGAVAVIARQAQPATSGADGLALLQRLWISVDSLGFYLLQIMSPRAFCPDYGRTPEWVLGQGITSASIVGSIYIAVVGWSLLLRSWRLFFGLLIFPAVLGPVLGILPFSHQKFSTVTDRYAYVAMLAPAFLFARLITLPWLGRVWPVVLGFVLWCGWMSQQSATHWQDTYAMWENVLVVNPESASAWTNLGHQHEVAGRDEQAIEFYERAVVASPTNALAINNIGNIHFRANRLEEANRAYKRARKANPKDLHARNNLGAVSHRRGQLTQAVTLFEEVIAINPNFAPAHHNLGLVAAERGDSEQAEECFLAALEIDPGFRAANRSLATALAKRGADEEARSRLALATGLEQHEMEFELAWSALLITLERDDEEIRAARLRAYELGCREPLFLVQLGRGLFRSENLAVAEEVLNHALELAPERIEPRLDLAEILIEAERWEECRTLLVETVRDFSFQPAPWHNLARYHLHEENPAKAEDALRTALRLDPDFAPSRQLATELGITIE